MNEKMLLSWYSVQLVSSVASDCSCPFFFMTFNVKSKISCVLTL
jgi:hypothetical protein